MSSGRFASLNEAELDQITDSRSSQNTKNATKYAVKTFRSYLLEKQYQEDFENYVCIKFEKVNISNNSV